MKKVFKKILFALPLLFVFFLIYIIPRLIIVGKIICNSQYDVCDGMIIDELNKSLNKKLPLVKGEVRTYLENNFFVKDFSIQYKIPDTLNVNIVIEKAKYCLKSEIHDVYSYINENGTVLELRNSCNLPIVFIDQKNFNVGEIVSSEYLSALNLVNQIFISYNIKEGSIVDNYLEVQFNQGYKVIFPLNKDNQVLLGSLRLIINRLNTEGSESRIIEDRINVIDLRYENPVLR